MDAQRFQTGNESLSSICIADRIGLNLRFMLGQRKGYGLSKAAQLPCELMRFEFIQNLRLRTQIAEAHAGNAEDFGHGAGDQQAIMFCNEINHAVLRAVFDEGFIHHKITVLAFDLMEQRFYLRFGKRTSHGIHGIAQPYEAVFFEFKYFWQRDFMIRFQQGNLPDGAGCELFVFTKAGCEQNGFAAGQLVCQLNRRNAACGGKDAIRRNSKIFRKRFLGTLHGWIGIVARILHAAQQRFPHPIRRSLRAQVCGIIQPFRGHFALPDIAAVLHVDPSMCLPISFPEVSVTMTSILISPRTLALQ